MKTLLVLIMLVSSFNFAYAAEWGHFFNGNSDGPLSISFKEPIDHLTINRLLNSIENKLPQKKEIIITLNSSGGSLNDALRAVKRIRELNQDPDVSISTKVLRGNHCESSCTVLFLAGNKRYAARMAKFGFHSPKYIDGHVEGMTPEQIVIEFRRIWIDQISIVDPLAARMIESKGYLLKPRITYVLALDLNTGYVTDLL